MLDTLEVVYRAANLEQANLFKNLLADEGIEAHITNAALQNAAGDLPYGGPIEPRLLVDSRNAARARQLALEFERVVTINRQRDSDTDATVSTQFFKATVRVVVYCIVWLILYSFVSDGTRNSEFHAPAVALVLGLFVCTSSYLMLRNAWNSEDPVDSSEDIDAVEENEERLTAWPTCPSCSRPRHTSCPVCQTAGSDFPAAFEPGGPASVENEREERALVICPTCDEAFAPIYLARCEWCGHRFADGRELQPPPVYTSPFAEMNVRAWIVLASILLALGAMVGVFAWIASQV